MIQRFSIGEFSKITGISAKTLRFYHEKGLLKPAVIDGESGYRFYDLRCFERARILTALKRLDFSLSEIASILDEAEDDRDLLDHLEHQKSRMNEELRRKRNILNQINQIITMEKLSRKIAADARSSAEVEEKTTDAILVAGIRTRGRYRDCGRVFGQLGRKLNRHIAGKAMCLYYDSEYREEDADFEPCFPVSKRLEIEGIDFHEIPAGRCLSLMHHGPYEDLGHSYARLFEAAHVEKSEISLPTHEIFVKGPGMIFKGNPKNYRTEIQIPIS